MWATSARAGSATDLLCPGSGGGATGSGSAGVGGADEQGAGNAAWRCSGCVTGRFWLTRAPQHDLPSGGAGGAPGPSHLACATRCGPTQYGERHRRNRLEGGGSTAVVVGGGE